MKRRDAGQSRRHLMKQTASAAAVLEARTLTEGNTGSTMQRKPFQKQSPGVTNRAPPNGCFFTERLARTDRAPSTRGEEPRLTHKPVKRGENAYGTPDPPSPPGACVRGGGSGLRSCYLWVRVGAQSRAHCGLCTVTGIPGNPVMYKKRDFSTTPSTTTSN